MSQQQPLCPQHLCNLSRSPSPISLEVSPPLAVLASSMCLPCSSRLPRSRCGGGRSHRQLWRIQHPDHGPPGHSPPVRVPLPTGLRWPFGVGNGNLVLLAAQWWGVAPILLGFMLCFRFPNSDCNIAATAVVTTTTTTLSCQASLVRPAGLWVMQGHLRSTWSFPRLPAEQREGSGSVPLSPLLPPGLGVPHQHKCVPASPNMSPWGCSHGCCQG